MLLRHNERKYQITTADISTGNNGFLCMLLCLWFLLLNDCFCNDVEVAVKNFSLDGDLPKSTSPLDPSYNY